MSLQEQIRANRVRSAFVVLGFMLLIGIFMAAVWLAFDPSIGILLGIVGIGYGIFSYLAAGRLVASVAHAHPVTKAEQPELVRAVENVAIAAGLDHTPPVYLIEDDAPNAFAAGRTPANAYVAATTGLVALMDRRELEAVMAHEISHIRNRDVRLMTLAAVLVGVIALMADLLFRISLFGGGRRNDREGGNPITLVIGIAALVLAPISAALLQASLSRRREYLADASAAEVTGDPEALALALAKLGNDKRPLKHVTRATAHLYIESPLRDNVGLRSSLGGMFDTHPPLEDRIHRLEEAGGFDIPDPEPLGPMTLPLTPPLEPQLAKTATEFPSEGAWLFEPKWDGFRVIAFVDGADVFLQSRNGKPLDRYFPELSLPPGRYVLDGEIVIDPGDGSQDFGALQQRIHPAASRVEMLSQATPASIVAFDLLAEGDEVLLERPFSERRTALERLLADPGGHPVTLTPQERTAEGAQRWLKTAEGVIAKQADAPYLPGKRVGMFKLRQRRTLDCVICGYRPGKEPGSVGSLILGLYGDDDKLIVVGHCSAFSKAEKRELLERVRPLETGERGSGEPSRWTAGRDLEWVELRPELVVEVSYDHMSDGRIRHGTRVERWRDDRDPKSCRLDQLV